MTLRRAKPSLRTRPKPFPVQSNVGYGRPPKEHQFKPGQSGNPKGRPKGRKNEATILAELLQRKISIRENGKTRRITILEAMLLRFTEDSLKGNTKSAQFILNRYHGLCGDERDADPELTKNDEDIIQAFADRIKTKR